MTHVDKIFGHSGRSRQEIKRPRPLHENPRFRQIVSDLEQDRLVERLRRRVEVDDGIVAAQPAAYVGSDNATARFGGPNRYCPNPVNSR